MSRKRRVIGAAMRAAIEYVAQHPGCSKLAVARHLLPRAIGSNNAYAYGPVNRALKAGLIRDAGNWRTDSSGQQVAYGNAYSLFVVEP